MNESNPIKYLFAGNKGFRMKEVTTINQTNVSTTFITSENEYFREMYSDSGLKSFTISVFFFGTIFGLVLESGIIWYEKYGNHRYRTVINRLFSTMSWFVVAYIVFVYIPDGIRYMIGPLNETFCDVHNFLKNALSMCVVLTLDLTIILRYIFIFKVSNFAVINDDLLSRFFQMTILVVGVWMAGVKRMSVGRMPLNYFMCSGKDPSEGYGEKSSAIRKFDSFGIVVVISFIVNIFALTKIFLYQRKMENGTQDIQLGQLNNSAHNDQRQNEGWNQNREKQTKNIPKSLVDLTTYVLCILFNLIFVIVIVAMAQIEPSKMNQYENRWLAYYIQIIGIAFAILGIAIQYYIRNFAAFKEMWKN